VNFFFFCIESVQTFVGDSSRTQNSLDDRDYNNIHKIFFFKLCVDIFIRLMGGLPVEGKKQTNKKAGFSCKVYKWSSHQGNSTDIPRESPFKPRDFKFDLTP
jgi:hypothetical protein